MADIAPWDPANGHEHPNVTPELGQDGNLYGFIANHDGTRTIRRDGTPIQPGDMIATYPGDPPKRAVFLASELSAFFEPVSAALPAATEDSTPLADSDLEPAEGSA